MNPGELIAEVGDDNVGLQILDEYLTSLTSLTNLTYSEKKGDKFTFVTDQPFDANGTEKLAEAFNRMEDKE